MRSTRELKSWAESFTDLLLAKRAWPSLAALVLTLAFTSPIHAQVAARLTGIVTDQSGAPISDAAVTAKDLETGAVRSTTTDGAGRYLILSLPVGEYEVRATKAGFKEAVRGGIQLVIGQEARIDLSLQV